MADEPKKHEGPTCACGKVDLYEEWLKQNEKDTVSDDTNPSDKGFNSPGEAGQQDQKPAQTRK